MNTKISYLIISFVFIVFKGFCQYPPDTAQSNKFEHDISQALKLKFIYRDTAYGNAYVRIFNDTIVGVETYTYSDPRSEQYFIQSLQNSNSVIRFNKPQWMGSTFIDEYRNGRLYFAPWSSVNLISFTSDGKSTVFINKDAAGLFSDNKVMLYQNKGILITAKNVIAFDLTNQAVLWQHDFSFLTDELSTIIDNKLYFIKNLNNSGKGSSNIFCYNLDNFKLEWQKIIKGLIIRPNDGFFQIRRQLRSDNGHFLIPTLNALYVVSQNNGETKGIVSWKGYFNTFSFRPIYKVRNDTLYVSDGQNLYCKNVLTNKVIWSIKNLKFHDLFKDKVIAYTKEDDFYLIINSATGKIENKVEKTRYAENLIFIDNYVMINRMALYK